VHFDAHYDKYGDFPNWYGAYDSAVTGPRSRCTNNTELMPSLDSPNAMTAQNTTRIAFELIRVIADRLAR